MVRKRLSRTHEHSGLPRRERWGAVLQVLWAASQHFTGPNLQITVARWQNRGRYLQDTGGIPAESARITPF